VYGDGTDAVADLNDPTFAARKKAVLAESKKRLEKLPAYIEKKKWYEVINELDRYMYETRGAVRGLAQSPKQKDAATKFFKSIESTNLNARLKKQDATMSAAKASVSLLDAFTATL
jgi:photosystem II oxygen-evolving enhancer protein 3